MENVSILMYLKSRKNSKGECQIYLRLTVDGKRKEVSLNRSIDPNKWDQKKQKGKGNSEAILTMNKHLIAIENKINQFEQELVKKHINVTVESLINAYLGVQNKAHYLIEVFKYENSRTKMLVEPGTYKKYEAVLNHVERYLLHQYKLTDIDVKQVDFQFVTDFDYYLRSERKIANNSTVRIVTTLKQIVTTTLNKGWIEKDPFLTYKVRMEKKVTGYLTQEEIDTIHNKEFDNKSLDRVKDVFIVCCYSGLAYADVSLLCKDDIITKMDSSSWLNINRKKTGTSCIIPILPIVEQIFEKYKNDPLTLNSGKLLPVKSNQKMNDYLKVIGNICNIKRPLTTHLARHTFATTIALSNGLPIETLSKIMGHKSLNMTLHYGKLLEPKLLSDASKFKENIRLKNLLAADAATTSEAI